MGGEAIVQDPSGAQQRPKEARQGKGSYTGAAADDRAVRVAIAGAGRMALHHARAIRRLAPGIEVAAIADPDPHAADRLLEIWPAAAVHQTLDHLLTEHPVDAVNICTPPSTHAALARTALEAGCHVYVEKPFAENAGDAKRLVDLAESRKLQIGAGHQQLFEAPARQALELLPALGTPVHVESFSSFQPLGSDEKGRAAPSHEQQLLDMLPHPVYLLLAVLERAGPDASTSLEAVSLGEGGTLHAILKRGRLRGALILTPSGRPVENYLHIMGTNGTLRADFVRSTVQRLIGPGTSVIDKLLNPYRLARQLTWTTTKSMAARFARRDRSYPGLREILGAFYDSVRSGGDPPVPASSIVETVRISEQIASEIMRETTSPAHRVHVPSDRATVVVTGATGFLGTETTRKLAERGAAVRAIARRMPARWERIEGAEYRALDLAEPLDPEDFGMADVLIHCAAETGGGWDAHRRNSISVIENVMRAAAGAGVRRVVHVSSLSVLNGAPRNQPLREDAPLVKDDRSLGPYVWGKAASEELARELAEQLGVELKIARPGALVDYREFQPPGLLGRRIGNFFLAVGGKNETLPVMDVRLCGDLLAWLALNFSEAPSTINAMQPDQPTKRALVDRLRRSNPDVRVVWLPRFVFRPLAGLVVIAQKILRRGEPVVDPARIFAPVAYDSSEVGRLLDRAALDS